MIGTLGTQFAEQFDFWNESAMSYLIGQKEVGATGYEHWQFCVGFHKKTTLLNVKRLFKPEIHLELTRSDAAHAYVNKEETAVPGTQFSYGSLPVRRNNKTDWAKVLSDAKRGAFDDIPEDIFIRYHSSIKRIRVDNCEPTWRHDINCHVYWGGSGLERLEGHTSSQRGSLTSLRTLTPSGGTDTGDKRLLLLMILLVLSLSIIFLPGLIVTLVMSK